MKKITKIIASVLALILMVISFASCGLVKNTEDVQKARITKETILKIGDDIEVNGAYYGYYFSSVHNEMLQANSESATDSSAEKAPEIKLEDVKAEAQKRIVATKMAYKKALENGIELSREDKQNINNIIEQMRASISQSGVTYSVFCQAMQTTPEGIEQVITEEYTGNLYYSSLIKDKFVSAKHILVEFTGDADKSAALSKIKDIKSQLNAGEDFDKLMNEYSTDPGLKTQPNGYTFTTGQMVEPFEKASFALKSGEVSDIVETDYGYHIIKRVETNLSGVASALTESQSSDIKSVIDAEKEKITKDIKVTETSKISYYTV